MGSPFDLTLTHEGETDSAVSEIVQLHDAFRHPIEIDDIKSPYVMGNATYMAAELEIFKKAVADINRQRRRIYLEQLKDAVTELLAAIEAEENSWK